MADKQLYYEWDRKLEQGDDWCTPQVQEIVDEVYSLNGRVEQLKVVLQCWMDTYYYPLVMDARYGDKYEKIDENNIERILHIEETLKMSRIALG